MVAKIIVSWSLVKRIVFNLTKWIYNCLFLFSSDVNMVTLLSYILLFTNDFSDSTLERNEITNCQETMIRMLQRYIFGKYSQNLAINLFAKVLNCVSDLQELCTIKIQRQMAVADPKKLMFIVEQEKLSTGNAWYLQKPQTGWFIWKKKIIRSK